MYQPEVAGADVAPPAPAEHPPRRPVSLDGTHSVLVPERLARLIEFAESLQAKVNELKDDMGAVGMEIEEVGRGFHRAIDIAKGINCHKAVLFARGEIGKELLMALPTKDAPELGGHPEVLEHLAANPERHVLEADALERFLASHRNEDGPLSVHVLRASDGEEEAANGEWTPAHSFIYLGTDDGGNQLCFHKKGPLLRMGFERATLEKVLTPYRGAQYSFLILPMNDLEEAA